jgi:hypothetical protein
MFLTFSLSISRSQENILILFAHLEFQDPDERLGWLKVLVGEMVKFAGCVDRVSPNVTPTVFVGL